MEINEFSDLTEFISEEYGKMVDVFGVKKPSNQFLKFTEKTLTKYSRVYDKPLYAIQKMRVKLLYRKQKLQNDIETAVFTMPHGFVWKLFHWRLWKKVKLYLDSDVEKDDENKAMEETVPAKVLYPAVVKPQYVPQLSDVEDNE